MQKYIILWMEDSEKISDKNFREDVYMKKITKRLISLLLIVALDIETDKGAINTMSITSHSIKNTIKYFLLSKQKC